MPQNEETTMTVRIPKEIMAAFDAKLREVDRNRSQIVRDLIKAWVEKDRQKTLRL